MELSGGDLRCPAGMEGRCAMQNNLEHHPLRKHFAGLVENAFCVEVGVCDNRLNDYLVSLMLDFLHMDGINAIEDHEGRRLTGVVELLDYVEHDITSSEEERQVHRHIGDLTLFWTGLFPEGAGRGRSANPDQLLDFVGRGKESYAIASNLTNEDGNPPGSLFRRLSADFEVCAHGLGLVRKSWEHRDFGDDPPPLVY